MQGVRSRTRCALSRAVWLDLDIALRRVPTHIIEWLGLLVARSHRHIYRSQHSLWPSTSLHYTEMGWTSSPSNNTPALFTDSRHCALRGCHLHRSSSWDPDPQSESTAARFGDDRPCKPYEGPSSPHYPICWHWALPIIVSSKCELNKMRLPALRVFVPYLLLWAHRLEIQAAGVHWLARVCQGWTRQ